MYAVCGGFAFSLAEQLDIYHRECWKLFMNFGDEYCSSHDTSHIADLQTTFLPLPTERKAAEQRVQRFLKSVIRNSEGASENLSRDFPRLRALATIYQKRGEKVR